VVRYVVAPTWQDNYVGGPVRSEFNGTAMGAEIYNRHGKGYWCAKREPHVSWFKSCRLHGFCGDAYGDGTGDGKKET
jgi:hypothetical protein